MLFNIYITYPTCIFVICLWFSFYYIPFNHTAGKQTKTTEVSLSFFFLTIVCIFLIDRCFHMYIYASMPMFIVIDIHVECISTVSNNLRSIFKKNVLKARHFFISLKQMKKYLFPVIEAAISCAFEVRIKYQHPMHHDTYNPQWSIRE